MNRNRNEIVAWIATQVLPHETDVRHWLRRTLPQDCVDDVIQESYCRLAGLEDVSSVISPRGYFFQVARNVVLEQVRRSRVVQIDTVAEMETLNLVDESPSPERAAGARHELSQVQRLIAALPGKCRRIFELRKIEGLPQREIARRLKVSENTVEKQASRGLMLIMHALAQGEAGAGSRNPNGEGHDRQRKRTGHRTPRR